MPKPEWGTKHRCEKCDTRFYDLRRRPIICPNCQEHVDAEIRQEAELVAIGADGAEDIDMDIGIESTMLKTDDDDEVLEDSTDVLDEGEEVSLDDIKDVTTTEDIID